MVTQGTLDWLKLVRQNQGSLPPGLEQRIGQLVTTGPTHIESERYSVVDRDH